MGEQTNVVDIEDDVDPFMDCSPRYFAFNEGMYDLNGLGYYKIFKR